MDASGIAAVAKGAGLTDPGNLATAVAIALAESGGNPQSHNARPPDNSYGLWQINMLGSMGPERRAKFGISSNDQLFDPATNARAMMMLSNNGTNFRPWTTFTSGAFLKHIQEARASVGVAPSTATVSPAGFTADTAALPGMDQLKAVGSGIAAVGAWVGNRHNWIRVGFVGLGIGLLFVGAAIIAEKPASEVLSTVGKMVPPVV